MSWIFAISYESMNEKIWKKKIHNYSYLMQNIIVFIHNPIVTENILFLFLKMNHFASQFMKKFRFDVEECLFQTLLQVAICKFRCVQLFIFGKQKPFRTHYHVKYWDYHRHDLWCPNYLYSKVICPRTAKGLHNVAGSIAYWTQTILLFGFNVSLKWINYSQQSQWALDSLFAADRELQILWIAGERSIRFCWGDS